MDQASHEEWRPVPDLPGIEASSMGRVRTLPFTAGSHGRNRVRETAPTHGCWEPVKRRFTYSHRGRTFRVHRLVCSAFHGPAPFEGAVAMHGDENSANNLPGNLSWGTQKENLNAPGFLAYCASRRGDQHPRAKTGGKRKPAAGPESEF